MTLHQYRGHTPSNVSKDAKYTVAVAGDIRLIYRVDARTRELLSTKKHPALVEMVNAVKMEVNGVPSGAFYINEFGDVLVPGTAGGCFPAGHYDATLEFPFEGSVISAEAPPGLKPGDRWPGPHPGVPYVLCAGGRDIKYELTSGSRRTEVRLSDVVGEAAAKVTAARIAAVKGSSGGRFYINERRELFAPVSTNDYAHFVYIGHLEDSPWFDPPSGYERP